MHGIYLKRHGVDVVLLEQEPKNIRSGHNAGIGFGPKLEEFLRTYDLSKIQNCTPAAATHIAYRKRKDFTNIKIERHTSSWGLMYRIMRANFDGLPSDPIPNPPPALEGDGKVEYRAGKKVTELSYKDGLVTVGYVGIDGTEDSITSDFVIGADGLHSTVRSLVQAPTVKEYSGYVSWRGVVPETDVSEDTVNYFQHRNALDLLKRNYIVCYIIPPDSGSFEPGKRLLNFIWYWPYPEGSPALKEVLTDVDNTVHSNTVPAGLVRPETWSQHLAANLHTVADPFAEVISKCKNPFVTKVNDALSDKVSFYDGHLVLVGDALATLRPHIAAATEQAAGHCLDLGKVWHGEMTRQQWEKTTWFQAKRLWLVSRAMGIFGVGGWWALLKILATYLSFMVKMKRSKI
ncbi:FAD/NAD(P)-binding domain-containing protein [Coniochaeta ligniaria NRRL 30616]|uniref:FAD/NAD(P)-binding domain-containing protein n=1 Tax=Coniochaeta ligniaria NRRL 30616 TaxID=1408157 RepID=A0A1J7J179_9PEZI|nr:FAD/NAD(P)-binding domain-containing protein [Coniochaeta ligniaria NRRL 30616]